MSVESRVIVGADDRERTAVVTIAIPAGGEVELDPLWRFVGWRDDMKLKVKREPNRIAIEGPDDADDHEHFWTVDGATNRSRCEGCGKQGDA
jgi:hypothetical protein